MGRRSSMKKSAAMLDREDRVEEVKVQRMTTKEKRFYKSPNSAVSKARTKFINKQRTISEDMNAGHFAVGFDDDD